MIGIVGYAVPSKTGIVVRELRKKLGIQDQMAIYHHGLGGFDNRWAVNTFTNGFPKSGNPAGRWEWEVQWPDLQAWTQREGWQKEREKITTIVFVGSAYGERTFEYAKTLGIKIVFVGVFEREPEWPDGADLYVAVPETPVGSNPAHGEMQSLPYPIDDEQKKAQWLSELGRWEA